ncbi:TIR domain-containing protein [Streptomyces sp. NBC_00237]|uniref:WD40 domain-containing protein n=1 Tax=Streptomyces sp. NBC_00237 TaxID=2975687 RepID=UPI00224F7804|nr:TIR domain-containing protein [Streptomyces sp. NBC_00237]MCX5201850.1 TIR domain-containing protein [Streptomyces sp. NBC_00237]
MASHGELGDGASELDFFISYSPADEQWASWIAWTLEDAGYRTVVQAWDFVAGTNFIDFMDRGVSESAAVIAVLSRHYARSTYGRMEWQAALRSSPQAPERKLLTVRVEDTPIEGLLATLTYVDLVGVADPQTARGLLLTRIEQALEGNARPLVRPGFPGRATPRPAAPDLPGVPEPGRVGGPGWAGRRRPVTAPAYPLSDGGTAGQGEGAVNVLHLAGPDFGRGREPDALAREIRGDLIELRDAGAPAPDLLVVTGDLTASGSPRECDQALSFLTALRSQLELPPQRVMIVPGGQDVSQAACLGYFHTCEADEVAPQPPYWPKWRHYTRLFRSFYQGLDTVFDSDQPWTLFPVPELNTVVAGFNSSIGFSHRREEQFGLIGRDQAAWFSEALRQYEAEGWLRIGALRHPLTEATRPGDAAGGPGALRDADTFARLAAPRLNLLLHGPTGGPRTTTGRPSRTELAAAAPPGRAGHGSARGPDGPGGPARPGGRTGQLKGGAGFGERTGPGGFGDRSGPGGFADRTAPGGPARPTPAERPGPLQLFGAAAPARFQLLRVTAEGAERWSDRPAADPETFAADWHRTARVFPVPDLPDLGFPTAAALPDRSTADDPVDSLVERVKEICRVKREGVSLRDAARRSPDDMAQILATWQEEGVVRQQRIAVHPGTPTEEDLDRFAAQVHATTASSQDTAEAVLVHAGDAPARSLRERAARHGVRVRVRSFLQFQGLLDLREHVAAQTAALHEAGQYAPDLYLPQRYRDTSRRDGQGSTERDGLVEALLELLDDDHGRFVLLLGDFGHGKTYALRELARRIPEQLPYLIPLLIPLNTLDRAQSLEGLVAAHLAAHHVDTIDLRALRYMLAQGRVVLLFDGFDELVNRVSYDSAADHLKVLIDACVGNTKIIVSSRTQHFKNQQQVLTALGEQVGLLPQRKVLTVEGFTSRQIHAYLRNTYADEHTADQRFHLLEGIPDLLALCRNPRLLSFVADLSPDQLRTVAGAGRALSPARLYEDVFTSWLAYEEVRGHGGPGAPPGLGIDALWKAVTALALRLWESGRTALRLDELTEMSGRTLTGLTASPMTVHESAQAVGAGTLLVRSDDGVFQFIHGSVVEWLVAREAAAQLDRGQHGLLSAGLLSQLSVEFLCDLADHEKCVRWVRNVLDSPGHGGGDAARANALRISNRLKVPSHADLRGARLAGEDLSHRDFSGVDLTGADLTGATLVGVNLTRADLTGARLTGARLDRADLTGADLTRADLSRARLTRARIADVRLSGSRWVRAALIDAELDEQVRAAAELKWAAIAPGMPVEAGFRPSAVGVPYGFDMRTSRLPEPIAYSPDGELLAVGSEDGGVLLCGTDNGLALRTLQGHVGRVYAVKFRPDTIATGGSDGTVRLWDPVTGRCRHRLDVHPGGVWPVSLDTEGTLLATGDREGLVTVWDTATGLPVHRLPGHTAPVYTTVFSPDGRLLVTGDAAARVRVWDLATGRGAYEAEGHQGAVYRARFSPDGTLLATADMGEEEHGVVRVWRASDGELLHELAGHAGRVYTLDFHPSGTLLASGDTEGRVKLWDPVLGTPAGALESFTGAVYQVLFGDEGRLLAACDSDGAVRVWTVADRRSGGHTVTLRPRQPAEHRGSAWACAFRPGDGQLLTVGNDGGARIWDAATGQGKRILRGHGRRVVSVRFSADGAQLAATGNDGVVRLWDTRTGQRTHELTGRGDRLVSAVYSPAESVLATASNDGDVYLWNPGTGEYLREFDAETEHVWAAAFTTDGTLLATANDDDTVRLWYRSTGAHVSVLDQHRGRVRSIAFRRGSDVLATGCDDSHVRVCEGRTGELLADLTGHHDRVYGVAFGSGRQGEWLASAGWDGAVLVWRDGELAHRLEGLGGRLWTVAAHPTRPLVASAGDDRRILLWDAETGEQFADLAAHTGRVLSVGFSPDGRLLASAGEDGTVRLWAVPDVGPPALRATLVGVPGAWAALTPGGGYKSEGDVDGEFWHVVGMARFVPGELDEFLPGVHRLPLGEEL